MAAVLNPESLVFVEEMGVHTSLALLYGYALKDERLCLLLPRNREKNTTLLSSMTLSGTGPFWPEVKDNRFTFHSLRHTCATLLLSKNINPKII